MLEFHAFGTQVRTRVSAEDYPFIFHRVERVLEEHRLRLQALPENDEDLFRRIGQTLRLCHYAVSEHAPAAVLVAFIESIAFDLVSLGLRASSGSSELMSKYSKSWRIVSLNTLLKTWP